MEKVRKLGSLATRAATISGLVLAAGVAAKYALTAFGM